MILNLSLSPSLCFCDGTLNFIFRFLLFFFFYPVCGVMIYFSVKIHNYEGEKIKLPKYW